MIAWLLANRRWLGGIAAGLVVIGAWLWIDQRGYQRGHSAATTIIQNQDRSAVDAANEASANRRYCVDAGGLWDVTTGQCRRR